MPIKKIKEYIKEARKRKVKDKEIKKELKDAGWDKNQIEKAFEEIKEKKDNSNKKGLKLDKNKVLLIVLVVLLLGGALIYFFISNQAVNLEPEEDITQSSYQILGTEGFSVFGDIDFNFNDKEKDQKISGNLIMITELENIMEKYGLYFLTEGKINNEDVRAKANVVTLNNELYVRWLELFDLSLLFPTSINSDQLTGRYLLVTDNLAETVKDQLKESSFQKELSVLLGADTDIKTTKEIYNDIANKLWEKEALSIISTEKEGFFDGKNKYELNIDFDNLFTVIVEALDQNKEKIETINEQDLIDLEEKREQFTKIEENIDVPITIWTEDGYIQKIEIDIKSKGKIEEDYEVELLMDFEFRDINERFGLERPAEYIEMDQLIEQK